MLSFEYSFKLLFPFVPNKNNDLCSINKLTVYSIKTDDVPSNRLECKLLFIPFKEILFSVPNFFYYES